MTTTEKFSHHTKCENCGSRDNRGVWLNPDDTIHHTYCFGCHEYSASGETTEKPKPKILKDMITGQFDLAAIFDVSSKFGLSFMPSLFISV